MRKNIFILLILICQYSIGQNNLYIEYKVQINDEENLFKDNDFLRGQEIRVGIEYDHFFKKTMTIDHFTNDFQGKTSLGLSAETVKVRLILKL